MVDQLRGISYQRGAVADTLTEDWSGFARRLRTAGQSPAAAPPGALVHRVEFEPGLTDAEVLRAERSFGFRFPPDLRAFLQTALPRGPDFPNWRSGDESELREWLDQPRQGILLDIEHHRFWLPEWGERPASLPDALHTASRLIQAAPKLIPVFRHRMLPDEPHLAGNPVFSVHQTDIIVYGLDLYEYLHLEFDLRRGKRKSAPAAEVRAIRFWDVDRFQEVRWG